MSVSELTSLPLDLVHEVASFLTGKDMARLSCASVELQRFAYNRAREYLRYANGLSQQCLLGMKSLMQFYHSVSLNAPHRRTPQVACGLNHSCYIKRVAPGRCAVYTFGDGSRGQLGNSETRSEITPIRVEMDMAISVEHVKSVACGSNHTVLLMGNNQLVAFGDNSRGQCGKSSSQLIVSPQWMDKVQVIHFQKVVAGDSYTAALTRTGRVRVWGGMSMRLELTDDGYLNTDLEVAEIAGGADHLLLLTQTGMLYAIGGTSAELGLMAPPANDEPCRVPSLVCFPYDQASIVQIDAGGKHSAVVTGNGQLFLWGSAVNGETGIGRFCTRVDVPTRVEIPSFAVQVSCGSSHTAVLTATGRVLTFGSGAFRQDGKDTSFWATHTPNEISAGDAVKYHGDITTVVAGGKHTALLTDDDLFMFGDASCCGGFRGDLPSFVPKLVSLGTRKQRLWTF